MLYNLYQKLLKNIQIFYFSEVLPYKCNHFFNSNWIGHFVIQNYLFGIHDYGMLFNLYKYSA